MIFPPQRGHARPRVVCLSTSIPSGLSSAISSITPQHYKDRTEDRHRRHQQHEHAKVESTHEATISGVSQRRAAHRTLRFHVTREKQDDAPLPKRPTPTIAIHANSSKLLNRRWCDRRRLLELVPQTSRSHTVGEKDKQQTDTDYQHRHYCENQAQPLKLQVHEVSDD